MMQPIIPIHHISRVGGVAARQCSTISVARWARRTSCRQYASSSSGPIPPRPNVPKPLPYKPSRSGTKRESASSPSPTSEAQSVSQLVRTRWLPLFGFGAATLCLGYFAASLVVYWKREPAERYEPGHEPQAPTGRPSIQSPVEFDLHLDKSEWCYGITKLRRKLGAAARGHVLEVAVGTGRNLEFYDWAGITDAATTAAEKEDATTEDEKKKKNKQILEKLEKVHWDRSKLAALEDDKVRSYTGLDISPAMLDIALKRMRQVVPHVADALPKKPLFNELASQGSNTNSNDCVSLVDNKIRILKSDAQSALPRPPHAPPTGKIADTDKYDTIIQTFGLCSVRDPVALLASMAASLQPETGRIVLLEHGRSSWWELVNGLLDRSARGHFERFGCWWNRDIERVVRDAESRVPGLEVVRLERPGLVTFGTHIWIELRVTTTSRTKPAKGPEKKVGEEKRPDSNTVEPSRQEQKSGGGWFGSSSLLSIKKPSEPKGH